MKYLIILLLLVGCSYISTNNLTISGKNIKCNPITRSCSGDDLNFEVERTTNMELF